MACMTGNELITYTREIIHESVADFWGAERLLVTLQQAQKRLALKMQRSSDRLFYGSCTIPTVAGTTLRGYNLPDGTLYDSARKCMGHIDFLVHEDSKPLIKGDFRTFHRGGTGKPLYQAIVGDYIYVYPIASAVYNMTLWYWYYPTAIAADDVAIDFLEGFEPMIALEAAKISLLKDEADLSDIKLELAEYWSDFRNIYGGPRIHVTPDAIFEDIHDDDDN